MMIRRFRSSAMALAATMLAAAGWKLGPDGLRAKDGQLVCAAHGASFDLTNGECTAGPCRGERLRGIDVHCEDGDVRLGPAGGP